MEDSMFIRRTFDEFLKLHSPADVTARDWVIDWRWLSDEAFESEHSLIDWPSWARLKTPRKE